MQHPRVSNGFKSTAEPQITIRDRDPEVNSAGAFRVHIRARVCPHRSSFQVAPLASQRHRSDRKCQCGARFEKLGFRGHPSVGRIPLLRTRCESRTARNLQVVSRFECARGLEKLAPTEGKPAPTKRNLAPAPRKLAPAEKKPALAQKNHRTRHEKLRTSPKKCVAGRVKQRTNPRVLEPQGIRKLLESARLLRRSGGRGSACRRLLAVPFFPLLW